MAIKLRLFFVALLISFLPAYMQAQRSFGSKPHSFFSSKSSKDIPVEVFPKVDLYSLYAEDEVRLKKGKSLRVGVVREVGLWKNECGLAETLANGDKLWRMGFVSEGAMSMSVFLSSFNIPAEAELFVYNGQKKFVLGKFVSENTLKDSLFYTQQVPGDTLYIEYYEPKDVEFEGSFFIKSVGHAYRDFFVKNIHPDPGYSSPCQINTVCPEGDNWRDQIRSVAFYMIETGKDIYMCSGTLVNNTSLDKTQYFLSACHCQEDLNVLGWVFYFNYQTLICDGSTGGKMNNSVTGAEIVAKRDRTNGSDFLLLKIQEPIPDTFNVYYAGWDKTSIPDAGACIHHPQGDWKKISIPKNVSTYGKYWSVNWISGQQNKGTTEPGSSGSPLFNAQKRIIGQLFGGSSSCDTNWLEDYYGKISESFGTSRSTIGTSLRYWLDPIYSNVQYLDGDNASKLMAVETSISTEKEFVLYPNPAKDVVTLQVSQQGKKYNCSVFTLNGEKVFETEISSAFSTFDFSFLKQGSYIMKISSGKENRSIPFTIIK